MRERDRELDRWLQSLRRAAPSADAGERWKRAISVEEGRRRHWASRYLQRPAQLAAAVAVGYFLGVSSSRETPRVEVGEPSANATSATVQYLFDKTE